MVDALSVNVETIERPPYALAQFLLLAAVEM
jgi:hypothetical protein